MEIKIPAGENLYCITHLMGDHFVTYVFEDLLKGSYFLQCSILESKFWFYREGRI